MKLCYLEKGHARGKVVVYMEQVESELKCYSLYSSPNTGAAMASLFSELKRRHVFRVAIAYIVTAWVLAQVAELLLDSFSAPEWVVKAILVLLIVGFPLAVILAWAFEMTPDGIKVEVPAAELKPLAVTTSPEVTEHAEAPAASDPASIAVLPFADMSAEHDQEYFSDGLAEELLNLLAKIPQLHVAARTSAFSFKNTQADIHEVADKLNVAHLLEGSVRKAGDQVRITVQLITAADGYHLWSETYDRSLENIFQVQDEIASAVVKVLKVKLLGETPTVNETDPRAFSRYLQGRHFMALKDEASLRKAIAAFEDSIELDANYAPAWAGLAEAHMHQSSMAYAALDEGFEKAGEAVKRALELDPDLAYAWVTLSRLKSNWEWDWAGATSALEKAEKLAPNNTEVLYALSELLAYQGQVEQAVKVCERIVALDPMDEYSYHDMGRLLIELNRLNEAEDCYRHLLSINPDHRNAHGFLCKVYLARGDAERALDQVTQIQEKFWRDWATFLVRYGLQRDQSVEPELELFIDRNGHDSAVQIAQIYALHGDHDRALHWLEVGFKQRDTGLAQTLLSDRFFVGLYGNPRFEEIADKIGLLQAYRDMPPKELLISAS